MTKTYIVGYDGSDASRAALRFVKQMAADEDEVLAAAVFHETSRSFGKGASDGVTVALDDQARADADAVLRKDGVPHGMRRVVGAGSVAEGLHLLAEQRSAAMIAVGVTHRGALGRLVPGSTGEHLLHGAPCPVAVVPADFTTGPVRTIVAAYREDTAEANAALHAAADLARRLDAKLRVVAVWQPAQTQAVALGVPYAAGELPRDLDERLRQRVRDVVDALPSGIEADVRVLTGPAGPVLVSACDGEVDLLVTGSRGYGPARSVLLGSVSRHLVDHAPCPVLVIPRAAPQAVVAEPVVAVTAAT
jgi:nucleotide-binding universal stress UspA family protein